MNKEEFDRVSIAANLAVERILSKGADDVFRPPIFSQSIESAILEGSPDEFRKEAVRQAIKFLQIADLTQQRVGPTRRSLVTKDHHSFRQVAWLDPFDAVKFLALTCLFTGQLEAARIPKEMRVVHSHRMSDDPAEIFDADFGYDSFRARSAELSRERVGQWKVVTDISNFFDRIGNHTLENHLLNVGCEKKYVTLAREMLLFWAGDRRSFGVPVGSDASRILSEAVLLNVDAKLQAIGILFVRYVDDFRIFAATRGEALKAIEILTTLLADEGLSLNSGKTSIYQIVETEEIAQFANRFAGGEHESINLEEKIAVVRTIQVSGRSSISRFYREPGKEALRKIVELPKETVINSFLEAAEADVEQQVKLVAKFFVYAEQDVTLLTMLLDRKITSIFYIVDALVKEADRFSPELRENIKDTIFNAVDWLKCAYPLQVPILRLTGHPLFREPRFVHSVVDAHLQTDSMLFYREAISLGYPCLDRARLRRLAIDVFENVPPFVQRAIYCAVKNHEGLEEDEKRPLLKNMKQSANDWFISHI